MVPLGLDLLQKVSKGKSVHDDGLNYAWYLIPDEPVHASVSAHVLPVIFHVEVRSIMHFAAVLDLQRSTDNRPSYRQITVL